MNLIPLLVANISGTIVQNNQTHLIINTGNDPVTTFVNVLTAIGIIVALGVSIYTLRKGIEDSRVTYISR